MNAVATAFTHSTGGRFPFPASRPDRRRGNSQTPEDAKDPGVTLYPIPRLSASDRAVSIGETRLSVILQVV